MYTTRVVQRYGLRCMYRRVGIGRSSPSKDRGSAAIVSLTIPESPDTRVAWSQITAENIALAYAPLELDVPDALHACGTWHARVGLMCARSLASSAFHESWRAADKCGWAAPAGAILPPAVLHPTNVDCIDRRDFAVILRPD